MKTVSALFAALVISTSASASCDFEKGQKIPSDEMGSIQMGTVIALGIFTGPGVLPLAAVYEDYNRSFLYVPLATAYIYEYNMNISGGPLLHGSLNGEQAYKELIGKVKYEVYQRTGNLNLPSQQIEETVRTALRELNETEAACKKIGINSDGNDVRDYLSLTQAVNYIANKIAPQEDSPYPR